MSLKDKRILALSLLIVFGGIVSAIASQHFLITPERAREMLRERKVDFTEEAFVLLAHRHTKTDLRLVSLYLKSGMSPDAIDQYGQTTLEWLTFHAAFSDDKDEISDRIESAKLMLDGGANINRVSKRYQGRKGTLLESFVLDTCFLPKSGLLTPNDPRLKYLAFMLNNGADPNVRLEANRWETPLLLLAGNMCLHGVNALLDAPSLDLTLTDEYGKNALMKLVDGSSTNSPMRVREAYPDARDLLTTVQKLLAKGVSLFAKDGRGNTAMHHAVIYPEVIKLLLERGASVDATNQDGATPLMMAAMEGQLEVVNLLFNAGANLNAVDKTGLTALEYVLQGLLIDMTFSQNLAPNDLLSPEKNVAKKRPSASISDARKYEQVITFLSEKGGPPRGGDRYISYLKELATTRKERVRLLDGSCENKNSTCTESIRSSHGKSSPRP